MLQLFSAKESCTIFDSSISNGALNQVLFKSKIGDQLILLLSDASENIDFGPIFERKTAALVEPVQYFASISGTVQPFSLGVLLNVRQIVGLQFGSRPKTHVIS